MILIRAIQLKKNFSNLSYPVPTTFQNDEKLHIFWFHFFSHPFYMGILCKERHIQMRLMYLNRSNRKLKWENSVKLRNIGLLITSLILIVTWACFTHFDHIDKSNPTEEEFFKFELPSSHNCPNDKKLHIFDTSSLVILSIWAYYARTDIYMWG